VPESERPILSNNLENSQLLKRLHNDALDLQSSLGSDQKDAAKRVRLSRVEHEVQLEFSRIADEISGAELLLNVDGKPSMAQLHDAAERLDRLPEQLSNVPRLYADLPDDDEMSKQLKVTLFKQ
jgi:hypothetical protein